MHNSHPHLPIHKGVARQYTVLRAATVVNMKIKSQAKNLVSQAVFIKIHAVGPAKQIPQLMLR